ncbi:hypothetical protein FRX31_006397, partial [Thalictrum thalictroides]
ICQLNLRSYPLQITLRYYEGSSSKLEDQRIVNASPRNLSLSPIRQKEGRISISKRSVTVQAGY